MRVCRWGNSLAVRLPAGFVAELGVKEGDEVKLTPGGVGEIEVTKDDRRERAMAEIARLARPLPPGYRFNRLESYERGRDD